MARCKICREKFEVKIFNQKVCFDPACVLAYSKEVKLKDWEKQSKKQNKPKTIKKVSTKEYLQKEVNKLARLIDENFNYNCIDCSNPFNQVVQGAHYHNVGGNENIRFNLHNIHSARAHCNMYSSEHKKGYVTGLQNRYGLEYYNLVETELSIKYTYLGLTESELKEALKMTRECIRGFKLYSKGQKDGQESREFFNKLIGIYK